MGIKPKFTKQDVKEIFDRLLDSIERNQIKQLQMLGEMCVNHARNVPTSQGFQDQSGNLRSSIGYMVFNDGVAVHIAYEQVKSGSEGAIKGESLARKVGEKSTGICLVVTAGMEYALYVESKGRDVISSAEKMAERELPRMLEKLVGNLSKL